MPDIPIDLAAIISGLIVAAVVAFFGWLFNLSWQVWIPVLVVLLLLTILIYGGVQRAKGTDQQATPKCALGVLQVIGSSAVVPIANDARDKYTQACTGAQITVTDGDSAFGLSRLHDAVSSGSSLAPSMIAMYDGFPPLATQTTGLSAHPMGVLILSIVAHRDTIPALNISTNELRSTFVKPGKPGRVAVGRRAGSGTRLAFNNKVLGVSDPGRPDRGNCPMPTGKIVSFTSCTEDSTAGVLRFVDGTPNAVGYAAVAPPLNGLQHVSVINIDGVAPNQESVRKGSYKFWTVENLYTAPNPTPLAKDFLEFLSHYKESNTPSYFVLCADAPKKLGVDCQ